MYREILIFYATRIQVSKEDGPVSLPKENMPFAAMQIGL